jgi:DinB superfamily
VAGALTPRYHHPLPTRALPTELAREIAAGLHAVDTRYTRATESIPPEQRDQVRADGGWSVHQILEHVALTNDAYLPPLRQLAAHLLASATPPVVWHGKLFAQWLVKSLTMTLALPAPKVIQPGPTPRANVLQAVTQTHAEVRTLMQRCIAVDWTAGYMTSPFAALLRLNFGDACVVVLRHSERHADQMERLVATLGTGRPG